MYFLLEWKICDKATPYASFQIKTAGDGGATTAVVGTPPASKGWGSAARDPVMPEVGWRGWMMMFIPGGTMTEGGRVAPGGRTIPLRRG